MADPTVSLFTGAPLSGTDPVETPVLVKVSTQAAPARLAIDICVVIDVSGSMGTEATLQKDEGNKESAGLTLLDIAKHGVKTVVATLGPEDRLAIVAFNHMATTVCPLTNMTESSKEEAVRMTDRLTHGGQTDIWAGIEDGLDRMSRKPEPGRLSHMMVLTDGATARRDEVFPELKKYVSSCDGERLPCTISTFGFGYSIDSELINDIAIYGSGTYSFIPDAGFVGTVFVNTLSNLMVTAARDVYLNVEAENGSEILSVAGDLGKTTNADGALRINLGTLQYGQSRDVILNMRVAPKPGECFVSASVQYDGGDGKPTVSTFVDTVSTFVESTPDATPCDPKAVEAHALRWKFVEIATRCLRDAKSANDENIVESSELVILQEMQFCNNWLLNPGDTCTAVGVPGSKPGTVAVVQAHEVRGQPSFRFSIPSGHVAAKADVDAGLAKAMATLKEFSNELGRSVAADEAATKALAEDVTGQTHAAFFARGLVLEVGPALCALHHHGSQGAAV